MRAPSGQHHVPAIGQPAKTHGTASTCMPPRPRTTGQRRPHQPTHRTSPPTLPSRRHSHTLQRRDPPANGLERTGPPPGNRTPQPRKRGRKRTGLRRITKLLPLVMSAIDGSLDILRAHRLPARKPSLGRSRPQFATAPRILSEPRKIGTHLEPVERLRRPRTMGTQSSALPHRGEGGGLAVPPGLRGGEDRRVRIGIRARLDDRNLLLPSGRHRRAGSRPRPTVDREEQGTVRTGLPSRLSMKMRKRRTVPVTPYRGVGLEITGHGGRTTRRRRRDPPEQTNTRPHAEPPAPHLLPGIPIGHQVKDNRGGVGPPQREFAGEPVPGQGGVPQGRRSGTGEGEMKQTLALVQMKLPGHEQGERPGLGDRRADAGEDGLRVDGIGEFDDGRGGGAGQGTGGYGRERGQYGSRVDEAALVRRGGRKEQRGPGHCLFPVVLLSGHHYSTVTGASVPRVTGRSSSTGAHTGRFGCNREVAAARARVPSLLAERERHASGAGTPSGCGADSPHGS